MNSYETIIVEQRGSVLCLTLNNPERLNAVSVTMHTELSEVFADAGRQPDIDAVVLTGAGRAFSAGGDARNLQLMASEPAHGRQTVREGRKIILDMLELDVPLIAMVNGDAIGLGASIALCCDIIIAADSARFGDPHVKMGLVAGDGGAVFWPLAVGPARAKEYLMTGKLMPAAEAERIGLINHVVPRDGLEAKVQEMLDALLALPKQAVRGTKRAVNKGVLAATNLTLEYSLSLEAQTMGSADFVEAVRAFVEKRKPVFTGR